MEASPTRQPWAWAIGVAISGAIVAVTVEPEIAMAIASPRDLSNRTATALLHAVGCTSTMPIETTAHSASQLLVVPVAVPSRTNASGCDSASWWSKPWTPA